LLGEGKIEAVVIGDLHYDGHMCNIVPDFNKQITREVKSVLRWAENRGISNVILEGDLCHGTRLSYEAQQELQSIFLLSKYQFYVILGNHDKISDDSAAGHSLEVFKPWIKKKFLSNVHLFEDLTDVEIDGAPVRFLPYPCTKFSKSRLNIAHIEVKGSLRDNGTVNSGDKLRESEALIVSGHLHTPHKIRNTHYTGTLYQTKFGEKPKKGFHHIRFKSVNDYDMEWIPHKPKYTLHDVVIEGQKDLARIPRNPTQLTRLIVRDGADVDPTDWINLPNVVKTSPFKTKEELVTVLTEDLDDGNSLRINPEEYLKAWLSGQSFDDSQSKRVVRLRKRLLNGSLHSHR